MHRRSGWRVSITLYLSLHRKSLLDTEESSEANFMIDWACGCSMIPVTWIQFTLQIFVSYGNTYVCRK